MFILAGGGGGGDYTTPQPLVTDYDQIMIPKYFIPKCQAEDHVHISRGVLQHSPTLSDRLWSGYDPQIFHTKVSGRGSCSY